MGPGRIKGAYEAVEAQGYGLRCGAGVLRPEVILGLYKGSLYFSIYIYNSSLLMEVRGYEVRKKSKV